MFGDDWVVTHEIKNARIIVLESHELNLTSKLTSHSLHCQQDCRKSGHPGLFDQQRQDRMLTSRGQRAYRIDQR